MPGIGRDRSGSRGFSLLEVLVFVVILGLAIVPIVGLGTATHRSAHFTEVQQLALARARALVDLTASLDFPFLAEVYRRRVGPDRLHEEAAIDPESYLGGPAVAALFGPFPGTPADENSDRLSRLQHKVVFVLNSPSDGEVLATVSWTDPAVRGGGVRSVRLRRVVVRKEEAFSHRVPLR